jgi:PIN domain nuclease of toxin-antitoxin system
MAFLLDSHVILWLLEDPSKFSSQVARVFESRAAPLYVSPVSAYELNYKAALGKLKRLPDTFASLSHAMGFDELPLTINAAEYAARLSLENKDPWDRLLSAQAMMRGFSLITKDRHIARLGAPVFW